MLGDVPDKDGDGTAYLLPGPAPSSRSMETARRKLTVVEIVLLPLVLWDGRSSCFRS